MLPAAERQLRALGAVAGRYRREDDMRAGPLSVAVMVAHLSGCGFIQVNASAGAGPAGTPSNATAQQSGAQAPAADGDGPDDPELVAVLNIEKKLEELQKSGASRDKFENLCKDSRAGMKGKLQEGGGIYELFMVCIKHHPDFVDLPSASHVLVPWADGIELRDFKRYVGKHACGSQQFDCNQKCAFAHGDACKTACEDRFTVCMTSYQVQ